jgi:hypothetical protein
MSVIKKQRQLGRVGTATWNKLKKAAKLAELSFTQWAVSRLLVAAETEALERKEAKSDE